MTSNEFLNANHSKRTKKSFFGEPPIKEYENMNYKCYSRNTYITKEKLQIDANIFAFYEIFLFIDVCEGEPRCTIVHMSHPF